MDPIQSYCRLGMNQASILLALYASIPVFRGSKGKNVYNEDIFFVTSFVRPSMDRSKILIR